MSRRDPTLTDLAAWFENPEPSSKVDDGTCNPPLMHRSSEHEPIYRWHQDMSQEAIDKELASMAKFLANWDRNEKSRARAAAKRPYIKKYHEITGWLIPEFDPEPYHKIRTSQGVKYVPMTDDEIRLNCKIVAYWCPITDTYMARVLPNGDLGPLQCKYDLSYRPGTLVSYSQYLAWLRQGILAFDDRGEIIKPVEPSK